ncbi:unnamed protein product [Calicophoron daubneyi]|uniref:MARVEL domain-containing protein n=1 Tax=Calicophoron daubneyi TaxID=300641 RepID=A0AAV2TAL8_CALDB
MGVFIRIIIIFFAVAGISLCIIPFAGDLKLYGTITNSRQATYLAFNLMGLILLLVLAIATIIDFHFKGGYIVFDVLRLLFSTLAAAFFIIAVAVYYNIDTPNFDRYSGRNGLSEISWIFGALMCSVMVIMQSVECYLCH